MKWITEIILNNYRAFGKSETINIPKGNHLLIYGENGSGKSSIYNGLKDFFSSSVTGNKIKFKLNKFLEAGGNKTGDVTVSISETGNDIAPIELKFNAPPIVSTNGQREIILANKFKGFLDYRRMLEVHSIKVPDGVQPNIFNLIIKELLSEHRIADPKGGTTTVELLEEYNRIAKILLNNKSDSNKFKTAKTELGKLEASVTQLLKNVFKNANEFLEKHFKNKVSIDLVISQMRVIKPSPFQKKKMVEELSLKIKYAGTEIEFYQVFLNEARLSSLAICIYLASIKTFDPESDTLKILYLDDVFIGLDTTNRFPLLEIIKKEFIDADFQVFISTYDREWFELSRHWFQTKVPGKIKSLELFIEDDGNPNTPDYPVIIPYDGNLAKAKAHFKSKDYPAAGNYLRKECEAIIKTLLPDTYKLKHDGSLIDDFEGLLNQLEKLYEDSNLTKPTELTDAMRIYRKALLNPSSHNDSKGSLFKKEIEDAFEVVTKLQILTKIIRTPVAGKGAVYTYTNVGAAYTAEFELAENIWKVEHGLVKTFSKLKFRILKWTWNGVEFKKNAAGEVMSGDELTKFCLQERALDKIFGIINHSTAIPIPANPNAEIKIGVTGSLNDLLQ